MNAAVDQAETAWAMCAAVVDTIVECQERDRAEGLGHD